MEKVIEKIIDIVIGITKGIVASGLMLLLSMGYIIALFIIIFNPLFLVLAIICGLFKNFPTLKDLWEYICDLLSI